MNIILLDKDSRKIKGNISAFESFIWTERYWDYGDFELVVPLNSKNVSLISLDDYLKIPTSETLMIIENIEYISPLKDEGGKFNITGRSLESIIDRRIILSDYKSSIKPEAYILQIMKECFGSKDVDRYIDYLKIDDSTDQDVVTEPVSIDVSKGTNIENIILPNLQRSELGFRMIFNKDNTFTFEVFSGSDKTYIVFSENNLLLQEAQVYQSLKDLKTFVLVGGNETDVEVELNDEDTKGIRRRETYISSYSSLPKDDPGYRKELELKGKNELEDHKKIITIDARLMNFGRYKIRRDYDLGDIITIQNPYYKATARVTEVIQSWNQEGYQIYPGFIVKDINVVSYKDTEVKRPKPDINPPNPKPEEPDIPVDQTPRKFINVEIISAIKMYTNFIIGGSSRTYHQIYIPNYDPADPENRPIKRFGVRLRGLLPEGWVTGLYSIYCDVFLGSEQKLETIRINFKDGDQAFIGEWYSYLSYNSPYIRLYLYVVANEIGQADIADDQEPFINGLVDIKLNNVDGQKYAPSENGDQLACQTTYIWENNGNFHRYCSTNSTNVTGIEDVDITIIRQNVMGNESMLDELDSLIDSGSRSYEYDTVSLDNVELAPIETGIIEVPPTDGNYDIPAITTQFENKVIGNFGWRQTIAEVIRSQLANPRSVSGSNIQEMNLLFKKKEEYTPEITSIQDTFIIINEFIQATSRVKDNSISRIYELEIDNEQGEIKTISVSSYSATHGKSDFIYSYFEVYGDDLKIEKIELDSVMAFSLNTIWFELGDAYKYKKILVKHIIPYFSGSGISNYDAYTSGIYSIIFNRIHDPYTIFSNTESPNINFKKLKIKILDTIKSNNIGFWYVVNDLYITFPNYSGSDPNAKADIEILKNDKDLQTSYRNFERRFKIGKLLDNKGIDVSSKNGSTIIPYKVDDGNINYLFKISDGNIQNHDIYPGYSGDFFITDYNNTLLSPASYSLENEQSRVLEYSLLIEYINKEV